MAEVIGEGRGSHRAAGAERVPPQHDRFAGPSRYLVDRGRHVGKLPIQRVRRPVAAGAEPTAVHRVRREVGLELGHQRGRDRVVLDGAVHQHHRWSLALHPDRQVDTVERPDREPLDLGRGGHRRFASLDSMNPTTSARYSSGCVTCGMWPAPAYVFRFACGSNGAIRRSTGWKIGGP